MRRPNVAELTLQALEPLVQKLTELELQVLRGDSMSVVTMRAALATTLSTVALLMPGTPSGLTPKPRRPCHETRTYTVQPTRLDDMLPRVYLPGQVRRLPHAEVARHFQDMTVFSGKQVLVSSTEGDSLTGDLTEPQACVVSCFTNTHIAVSCSASSPTMAAFVE
jgi:hypothetical protein